MARAKVPSLAKLNLHLRVLDKRPDGYHELRTIFQTISLHDTLEVSYEGARKTSIALESSVDIADNLVYRAAELAMAELGITGRVTMRLAKRLPMGAGLGGGSSNAAAVLLALPALAGRRVPVASLAQLGARLGSDVPFFLYGGTAMGIGRGAELYPLPDVAPHPVVVVTPRVHVATAEAYRDLNRSVTNALTSTGDSPILGEFQTITWTLNEAPLSSLPLINDFEQPVLVRYPQIASALRTLKRLGARPARMTGSGSALFGVFESRPAAEAAALRCTEPAFAARFVTRRGYRRLWRRALGESYRFCCLQPEPTS